jgi:hypothetical protein
MPRNKRGRKQKKAKRKANRGSFRPVSVAGPDPRRHVFTPSDCRVGWLVANILHPELREWLRMRLFCYYSERRRQHGQEERLCHSGAERNGVGRNDSSGGDDIPF